MQSIESPGQRPLWRRDGAPSRDGAAAAVPSDFGYTLAVAFVALLPRLFVAVAWASEPVWDGHYYHFGATRIAEGLGYSEDVAIHGHSVWKPWAHYPVGYSALLALVYRVFGSGLMVAPLVNAVVGTLLVVVAHRLARHALSEPRARLAAGLVALHPGLISYSAAVMTEQLAALLVLATLWGFVALRRGWVAALGGGALLGLSVLVRPATLLLGPVLVAVRRGPFPKALAAAAGATAVAVLVVLPWTLRNCRTMDGCAFVSTNAGWNLAIGAISRTGRFDALHARDGCPVVTGQVQQDRCWLKVGLSRIQQDPVAWARLVPRKLGQTYVHESFPINYLRQANPAAWSEARSQAGRELLTWVHRLLMVVSGLCVFALPDPRRTGRRTAALQALLALGLVTWAVWGGLAHDDTPFYVVPAVLPIVALVPLPGRPRLGPAIRGLLGLLAITTLTHAVFFGDDRYHLVISPVLCILAAAAWRPSAARRGSVGAGSTSTAPGSSVTA
jgi:4-amino-4-deoxy-L-arabinose transferase-like glycosyltransferase